MKGSFICPIAAFLISSLSSYSQSIVPTSPFDPTAPTNSITNFPPQDWTNPILPSPPFWSTNVPSNVVITLPPGESTNVIILDSPYTIPPTSPTNVSTNYPPYTPIWPSNFPPGVVLTNTNLGGGGIAFLSGPWACYVLDSGTVAIVACNFTESGTVEIPASLDGYTVSQIGSSNNTGPIFSGFLSESFSGSVTNIIVADGISIVSPWAFANSQDLVAATIPDSVTQIGDNAFANCTNLARIRLPSSFWNELSRLGLSTNVFIENFSVGGMSAALNQSFVQGANSMTDQIEEARTAGRAEVTSNPTAFNLFTEEQFDSNRVAGQSDVINNPTSYGLHTSDSIMDLQLGGVMVQKNGTDAIVSFQPQTTTDLTQPFTNNGTPITHTIPIPGNKGFIRINAKPVATPIPPQP